MMRVALIIALCVGLAGCAGVQPKAQLRELPPACVALPDSTFTPERRPSVGEQEITDQVTARVLGQASRAINSGNARLADLSEIERQRVELGCVEARQ